MKTKILGYSLFFFIVAVIAGVMVTSFSEVAAEQNPDVYTKQVNQKRTERAISLINIVEIKLEELENNVAIRTEPPADIEAEILKLVNDSFKK